MNNLPQNPQSCQTDASGSAFSIHDLKCGNILNYHTAEGEILPTVIDWQGLKWLTEDSKGFNLVHSPIKLNDSLIIRLGFENWGEIICKDYEKYHRWVLHNAVGGTSNFEVHIIYSNYGGQEYREICFSVDNDERQFLKETDFLHNLQNCYQSITGVMLFLS
jgi:hypothetical protein